MTSLGRSSSHSEVSIPSGSSPIAAGAWERMNNNGWQHARHEAHLPLVRVHDLRHSFACRLRAAGVSAEDREVLLGHANHSMAGHYASADVGRLLQQANLVAPSKRHADYVARRRWSLAADCWKSHADEENLVLRAKCMNRDALAGTGG